MIILPGQLGGLNVELEFQENYFVSENYCYSNFYSEMSGKGYTEVPPNQRVVCMLGLGDAMYGRWSIAKWPEKIGGPSGSRRFCSNLTILLLVGQPGPGKQEGEPEQAGVEACSERMWHVS